jgi:transposase-like protein
MHFAIVPKTCPECGSKRYRFRARRTLPAEAGKPAAVETKYRCAECEHEWKVRVEGGAERVIGYSGPCMDYGHHPEGRAYSVNQL